jgi:hypothetical protein
VAGFVVPVGFQAHVVRRRHHLAHLVQVLAHLRIGRHAHEPVLEQAQQRHRQVALHRGGEVDRLDAVAEALDQPLGEHRTDAGGIDAEPADRAAPHQRDEQLLLRREVHVAQHAQPPRPQHVADALDEPQDRAVVLAADVEAGVEGGGGGDGVTG